MNKVQILLVDSRTTIKPLLEKQLQGANSVKFVIALAGLDDAERMVKNSDQRGAVVLFGEQLAVSSVAQLARSFREQGFAMPLLMLTKQSEARVPRNLRKAGIDDMLNIAEIDTPLLPWTFISIIKQKEMKKKVEEFDAIKDRLQTVHRSLSFITHEINSPLGVIRLTVHHLANPNLANNKKKTFVKILARNVKKVDAQITELQEIRRQLGEGTSILNSMLLSKTAQEAD